MRQGVNQNRDSISIWRVYLPTDMDRETYVKSCYLSGRVSLINENGEFQHRVKVGKLELQAIDFPSDKKSYGSEVACISAPYSGRLYIVSVYSSSTEFNDQEENQYRFFKTNGGFSELRVSGDGKIIMSVDSESDASEVSVNITSKNKAGKLKLNVNGDILIQNEGNTSLTSSNNVNAKVTDGEIESSVDIKKNEIRLVTPDDGKVYLNESDEPILLGNKTVTLIEDLLTQLGKESAGPYPLLGNSFYISMKNRLEELKSKISFVK